MLVTGWGAGIYWDYHPTGWGAWIYWDSKYPDQTALLRKREAARAADARKEEDRVKKIAEYPDQTALLRKREAARAADARKEEDRVKKIADDFLRQHGQGIGDEYTVDDHLERYESLDE